MKLKQKYKECVKFATRDGKSDIILIDRTTKILSEDWYNTRKANLDDESVRIVQTAATLIKDAIRNHELESNVYPSMDDIAKGNNLIPDLLKTFVNELIKSPVKQMPISQAIDLPEGTAFLQFVADITDHGVATLGGGRIGAAGPAHGVPGGGGGNWGGIGLCRGNWGGVGSCGGVKMRRCFGPGVPALAKAVLRVLCVGGAYSFHFGFSIYWWRGCVIWPWDLKSIIQESIIKSKIENDFSAPRRLSAFICQVIFGFTLLVVSILEIRDHIICLGHW